ncbi:MAG TPA: M48 family metallopeptidase [Gemmatimonadales bacterium]|jgi:Zn-dependent protease with chaperone function|nr:M48 family metallopeptidase [Gemmatimonadales bacterium]
MRTPQGSVGTSPGQFINPRERWRYGLLVVVSLTVYGVLVLVGLGDPKSASMIVTYGLVFALLALFGHGLALGRVRGNSVRVSERQFPQLHRLAAAHARKLGMENVPAIYLMQSGGLLNAFATRFLGRDFIIIYSDVLELALAQGEAAVGFIVGHELGHIWRGHLKYRWLTAPGRLFPYLGPAYSRACEYTCDRIGAFCQPDGAISGLLALAAGKQLHAHVDVREFAAQAETDKGFWVRRAEIISSHPILPKRVAALLKAGVTIPARSQLTLTSAAA